MSSLKLDPSTFSRFSFLYKSLVDELIRTPDLLIDGLNKAQLFLSSGEVLTVRSIRLVDETVFVLPDRQYWTSSKKDPALEWISIFSPRVSFVPTFCSVYNSVCSLALVVN